MSCSKPLPPFLCDSLYYLNRDQLDRFTIVCRPLKNFIERYLHAKPYRVFDELGIRRGLYLLCHNHVQWHPNRTDYSAKKFLDGQICSIDEPTRHYKDLVYYSFTEMRLYLGPTVRIKKTFIHADEDIIYTSEHIAEMESITYLWHDADIIIENNDNMSIVADDLQPILKSPTILQCRKLNMINAYFSFKDYDVLYTVKIMEMDDYGDDNIDPKYWLPFLEQPGDKPIVALHAWYAENIENLLDCLKKAFSSAVVPTAFEVVFLLKEEHLTELTEFRETNKTSGEILELKKGLPVGYQDEYLQDYDNYTLERSNICVKSG